MGYTPGRSGRTMHCRRCGEFVNPRSGKAGAEFWGVCIDCWELENVLSRSMFPSPAVSQDEIDEALIKIYGLSNMCREWAEES